MKEPCEIVTKEGAALAREVFEVTSELRRIRYRIDGLRAAEASLSWRAAEAKERLDRWITDNEEG